MADEFILGKHAQAERFALSQGWSAVGRPLWLKPDGTCVHFIGVSDQLAGVKRGERVYVIGEPDAATASALKKAQALVAMVYPDETITHSGPAARNFPAPWKVERTPGGFVVKDANGLQLVHVYSDNKQVVNTLTEDEARRIASNIAKLPGLLSAKDH
jgi:hypothetical protein